MANPIGSPCRKYNSTNNTETYSGIINRKDNLDKMLKILGSGDIHYQINGKKLTLLP